MAALAEVVKRVALVADRTTPVRMSFAEGEVVIEAGGSEDARASEAMECEFTGEPLWLTTEASALGSLKVFGRHMLRRSRAGRRALLGYTLLLGPDAPLAMLCRKPG